jgi:pilus assembly protein CpaC
LQTRGIGKVLAEPNIVAVSGRPAQFLVGGEQPIPIPQSLGTTSIEFKQFGTIVDFLPIVLGNGNIRLEVRPQVSTPEYTVGAVTLEEFVIPRFITRKVDTAVEMKAGQTFALAGLVEEKTVTRNTGIPYLSDMPVIGVPFRRTADDVQEIELLVMVTPEFVDPLDQHQVPCGGPGTFTTSPTNRDLYCGGHVEVPLHCNPTSGLSACGDASCTGNGCVGGCQTYGGGGHYQGGPPMITDGLQMPGGVGYDESYAPTMAVPGTVEGQQEQAPQPDATGTPEGLPNTSDQPMSIEADGVQFPNSAASGEGVPPVDAQAPGAGGQAPYWSASRPQYTAPRPYSPARQPVFTRNASNPNNQTPSSVRTASKPGESGLIGPVGYDPQ